MASRRFTQFEPRKLKVKKSPDLKSGPHLGNKEIPETTGPYTPLGGEAGSGFNRASNFPVVKAYVKKAGL